LVSRAWPPGADRARPRNRIPERLPGGVPHDEAGVVRIIERPRRRDAASGGQGARIARSGCERVRVSGGRPAIFSLRPNVDTLDFKGPRRCSMGLHG
jgi:hypothetical protein